MVVKQHSFIKTVLFGSQVMLPLRTNHTYGLSLSFASFEPHSGATWMAQPNMPGCLTCRCEQLTLVNKTIAKGYNYQKWIATTILTISTHEATDGCGRQTFPEH